MEEEFKKVDLITLLRTFKKEGISNFVVIRKEKFENNFILKSKLKEFFSSRLEKYQEADDGKYEQDYLTRGELELVDRYKECKEIAKIILEEEINSEVPQNCIPKFLVKEKIEELDIQISECEYADDDIEERKQDIEKEKRLLLRDKKTLQDLLERSGEDVVNN